MKSSVVIGIGNPTISDDAIGIEVVRRLSPELENYSGIKVSEVYNGGFELMEAMAGFDKALLVDAIVTGAASGTIHRLSLDKAATCRNYSTTHNASISVAMQFGRLAGLKIPKTVQIWAVEAGDVSTFFEGLTPEVKQAVPAVAAEILEHLLLNKNETGGLDS